MTVAFIGLGIMGMPMATNVSKKYDLIGYDVLNSYGSPSYWACRAYA